MDYIPREELIDVIVRNNMVEEFVAWLRSVKGYNVPEPISLRDIDYDLLLNFALFKKLVVLDDTPDYIKDAESVREAEDEDIAKKIERQMEPKKIRRKT
uniref:Uncharacterized protein n=1 Tax=Ignisphaera aggregans TaxID=334771 RepID=A0A7C2VM07_9CREN